MKKILVLLVTMSLIGCAQYGGFKPTVDTGNPYTYQSNSRLDRDMQDCQKLAESASGGAIGMTARDMGIGAIIGGAGGAVTGAFLGNPALGAAVGASAGAFGGAANGGLNQDYKYRNAYNNCLERRGHTVIR